ncbi:MAG: malto-oligosyltrehalose synthase [Chitinispirillaceae bacterium]|nr:malto-oligosyltrehalose synthase [Chitinispirillaceae bacterium]
MTNAPLATYRLQCTPSFTFKHVRAVIPYLAKLGISHIYASPIFTPRTGSTHGYDVADPTRINPELGGEDGFAACARAAAAAGLGWIQDIVPNHMVFSKENRWLMEVMENGPESRYAHFFDIEWNHLYDSLKGRILAPVLGGFYGECLASGEITLGYDREGLHISYFDHRLPVRVESYFDVLGGNWLGRLRGEVNARSRDLSKFFGVLYSLKNLPGADQGDERGEQIAFAKDILWELYDSQERIRSHIDGILAEFNADSNRNLLDDLLSRQHFRLSFWKVASEELDYRRFFTINDLISLRIEDESVFTATHATLFDLMKQGYIQGLRIDHVDGLRDPQQYVERLRERTGDCYLVVEKILGRNESLPTWPVHGTTGYDTMNIINGFFCDTRNRRRFDRIYARFTGLTSTFSELSIEKKRLIIGKHMAGDIDNLAHQLKSISSKDRFGADITLYGLRRAFVEFLTFFPVYRTYIDRNGLRDADREYIKQALDAALQRNPGLRYELKFIETFMLLRLDGSAPEAVRNQWIDFCMRVQQFTGPIMAKGVEDTVLYGYHRLVSLNDVGADPSTFGVQLREFHAFFVSRARHQTLSMNATATHDTKRGEDARARLNTLSEMPVEWLHAVKEWRSLNAPLKPLDGSVPDTNDEYLFYQTIIGTLPFDSNDREEWKKRIAGYMIKAVREAKVHTEWLQPDTAYEDAVISFVNDTLNDQAGNAFFRSIQTFAERIAFYGMLTSLSQTLLKLTVPGVPDLYQGTERWDLSLVDPDNRRPVDYALLAALLESLTNGSKEPCGDDWTAALASWRDGQIKLLLIARALAARKRFADVFSSTSYIPLRSQGRYGRHCVAFLRRKHLRSIIVIVPRFFTKLVSPGHLPLGSEVWDDTGIEIKHVKPGLWKNELSNETMSGAEGRIELADALRHLPVALLSNEERAVTA